MYSAFADASWPYFLGDVENTLRPYSGSSENCDIYVPQSYQYLDTVYCTTIISGDLYCRQNQPESQAFSINDEEPQVPRTELFENRISNSQSHSNSLADVKKSEADKYVLPSWAELIYDALKCAPECQLCLNDLYRWMEDRYPDLTNGQSEVWKQSIRYNLSMNGGFFLVEGENGPLVIGSSGATA
ncbi:hypothetical protein AA313_de0205566 [Arthrobotrys entomopaga]|nr:hypothetical protein AA313_de0205566 [Arthrobotrys entomopaga]